MVALSSLMEKEGCLCSWLGLLKLKESNITAAEHTHTKMEKVEK